MLTIGYLITEAGRNGNATQTSITGVFAAGDVQDQIYKQLKLDEPWDSDHNKKLVAKMPAVFASPSPTRSWPAPASAATSSPR